MSRAAVDFFSARLIEANAIIADRAASPSLRALAEKFKARWGA